MLKIVGKCIHEETQLRNSVRDGFTSIELQLFSDFLTQTNEEVFKLVTSIEGLHVSSIHSPLLTDCELEIEDIADSNTRYPLLKTFYLADMLGEHFGMMMPVVVHATSNITDLMRKKDTLYTIGREIDIALQLFPHLEICIENTIPVISKGDRYETKNSFLYDTVEICKFLRNHLKTDRIYTVLDTCHALTSIRFMKETQNYTNMSAVSLEEFFRQNGELTRIIHLNNVIDLGLKPGQHSVTFLPNSVDDTILLKHITDYIQTYTPQAECVLEVNEEEYLINSNANKLLLLESLDKLNVEHKHLKDIQ